MKVIIVNSVHFFIINVVALQLYGKLQRKQRNTIIIIIIIIIIM
jgi:hypothetical protein